MPKPSCIAPALSVGAMKIARNVAVSGRHVEWYNPFPAPSLRELLSAAKLRECTSMNVNTQKFQSSYVLVGKPLASINHRTTLPQSALSGCQLPQRGSRDGLHHSSGYSLKSGVSGDFHRPYETQKPFSLTIHRTTLPQSRPLGVTAPSGREPGNVPIHRAGRKIRRCGRFSSPLRDSEVDSFYHSVRCG